MNIHQAFVSCRRHYQKSFRFIDAFERSAADRRHENGLAVGPVNEVGLFLVAFLLPFEPSICKADRPAMLPQRFKHSIGGRSFDARVNQWRLIPPPGRVAPEYRIEVQLFVAFAQQQHFGAGRDVVTPDGFRIVYVIRRARRNKRPDPGTEQIVCTWAFFL